MVTVINPFISGKYISSDYFCGRKEEIALLTKWAKEENNVLLTSKPRIGKSYLVQHFFQDKEIQDSYYCFYVDIYATKSIRDFAFQFCKSVVKTLCKYEKEILQNLFLQVQSLRGNIFLDSKEEDILQLELGDLDNPWDTFWEILKFLSSLNKPCIIGINAFQQVLSYLEKDAIFLLKETIEESTNIRWIMSFVQKDLFNSFSFSEEFTKKTETLELQPLPINELTIYVKDHFRLFKGNLKDIEPETIAFIYKELHGITQYIQEVLSILYYMTPTQGLCAPTMVQEALTITVNSYHSTFRETFMRLPEKQKELLIAIAKEGKVQGITSGVFIKKHKLLSASSVQAALKGLIEKDFLFTENNQFELINSFLITWIKENY